MISRLLVEYGQCERHLSDGAEDVQRGLRQCQLGSPHDLLDVLRPLLHSRLTERGKSLRGLPIFELVKKSVLTIFEIPVQALGGNIGLGTEAGHGSPDFRSSTWRRALAPL